MCHGVKPGKLRGNAFGAVRIAEMRHQRNFVNLGQCAEPGPGVAVTLGHKAQAVHTRVHFQKNAVRHLRFMGSQHVDLFVAMHHMPQPQAGAQLQVTRFKTAFQQQDGAAPVQRTQALCFGQVQQRKAVSTAQTIKRPLDAVAIGVGLDDGPHAGIRSGCADAGQVVGQCGRVDGGKNRARHKAVQSRNEPQFLAAGRQPAQRQIPWVSAASGGSSPDSDSRAHAINQNHLTVCSHPHLLSGSITRVMRNEQ